MVSMVDRHPEGRESGGEMVDAVEEKTVRELLSELIREVALLRLAMVRRGVADDLGDQNDLEV